MLLQVLKPGFNFIYQREKLEKMGNEKNQETMYCLEDNELMSVNFFSTKEPPIKIAALKGRCVTGKFFSDKVFSTFMRFRRNSMKVLS